MPLARFRGWADCVSPSCCWSPCEGPGPLRFRRRPMRRRSRRSSSTGRFLPSGLPATSRSFRRNGSRMARATLSVDPRAADRRIWSPLRHRARAGRAASAHRLHRTDRRRHGAGARRRTVERAEARRRLPGRLGRRLAMDCGRAAGFAASGRPPRIWRFGACRREPKPGRCGLPTWPTRPIRIRRAGWGEPGCWPSA